MPHKYQWWSYYNCPKFHKLTSDRNLFLFRFFMQRSYIKFWLMAVESKYDHLIDLDDYVHRRYVSDKRKKKSHNASSWCYQFPIVCFIIQYLDYSEDLDTRFSHVTQYKTYNLVNRSVLSFSLDMNKKGGRKAPFDFRCIALTWHKMYLLAIVKPVLLESRAIYLHTRETHFLYLLIKITQALQVHCNHVCWCSHKWSVNGNLWCIKNCIGDQTGQLFVIR